MIYNTKLSKHFWVEIVNIVYFLVSISSSNTIVLRTLEEDQSSYHAEDSILRIYGYLNYTHVK